MIELSCLAAPICKVLSDNRQKMNEFMPSFMHRFFLRRRMRQKENGTHHPAVEHVKNYLSGTEHCVVLWGPEDSMTAICAKTIADGIIKEGFLAKVFHCDQIASGQLQGSVLSKLGCKSLDDFVKYLPKHGYSWLIFDSVESTPDAHHFFSKLIHLSRNSATKFKILLFTNQSTSASSILKWSDQHRITLVQPVGCCRWKAEDLQKHHPVPTNMELSIRAGCPRVFTQGEADELAARWEMNVRKLQEFIEAGTM